MNVQNLAAHKKMLAVIIGVAIFATAGVSSASAQTVTPGTTSTASPTGTIAPKIQGSINIEQLLMSKVTIDFSTAANTAAGAVTNGKVIGGGLKPVQGFLVYAFRVVDNNNMAYSVIVDPSSGSVLYTSPGHAFHGFGMGHAVGMMKGGFKHGGGNGQGGSKEQNAPSSSTGTAPSSADGSE